MKRFIRSVGGKTLIFICTVLSLIICCGGVLGIALCAEFDIYTKSSEELREECFAAEIWRDMDSIFFQIDFDSETENDNIDYNSRQSNLRYAVYDADGELIRVSDGVGELEAEQWQYCVAVDKPINSDYDYCFTRCVSDYKSGALYYGLRTSEVGSQHESYEVLAYIDESLDAEDNYYYYGNLIDLGHSLKYALIPLAIASLLLSVLGFAVLMCVSGRRPVKDGESDEVHPGVFNRIPFDIMLAAVIILFVIGIMGAAELFYSVKLIVTAVFGTIIVVTLISILLGLCMSIAARLKQGTLIKNTLIAMACCIIWRGVKAVWRIIKRSFRFVGELLHSIPMIWKTSLVLAGVMFIEFIFICACWWETDVLLLWWIIEKMIMTPVVMYSAICLRRLQKAGEKLAAGELGYKADTRGIFWDLKRHAENLNSIADGMSLAVDERMKSERMKTELITNVSHDIKTPLTSIINYVDLISREECDNERIAEYTEVLSRQSARLKRLIEDLVEASKAATGNLEVVMSMCDANVFISQAAGEYEHRLNEAGLQIVVSQPEDTVYVMADGRRMLRIFDNLMNNICKYAQGGTRVYLSLERAGENAVITFKNVSREPLNISADELMERFVRGDSSRNTEGSGLGLSIAKSLTELQGGTLELSVDGDLFKAILTFPVVQ